MENRVCQAGSMYFSSVKSLVQQHRKVCKKPRKGGAAVKNKHSVNRKATLLDDSDDCTGTNCNRTGKTVKVMKNLPLNLISAIVPSLK